MTGYSSYCKGLVIHWKTVEQYFTVELHIFQFYLGCNFGLGTLGTERVTPGISNLASDFPFAIILFS